LNIALPARDQANRASSAFHCWPRWKSSWPMALKP